METEEVVRSLASTLTPVRRLRPAGWRAAVWVALSVVSVSIGTALLGPRSDLLQTTSQTWLQTALLLFAFAASAVIAFETSVPGRELEGYVRFLPLWALLVWGSVLAGAGWASHAGAATRDAGWPCLWKMACLAVV